MAQKERSMAKRKIIVARIVEAILYITAFLLYFGNSPQATYTGIKGDTGMLWIGLFAIVGFFIEIWIRENLTT